MRGRRFGLCCSPRDGSENKRGDKSRDQKPKCGAVHDSGIVPQWERSRNAKRISSGADIMSEPPDQVPEMLKGRRDRRRSDPLKSTYGVRWTKMPEKCWRWRRKRIAHRITTTTAS